jgi:hypothetical protein
MTSYDYILELESIQKKIKEQQDIVDKATDEEYAAFKKVLTLEKAYKASGKDEKIGLELDLAYDLEGMLNDKENKQMLILEYLERMESSLVELVKTVAYYENELGL